MSELGILNDRKLELENRILRATNLMSLQEEALVSNGLIEPIKKSMNPFYTINRRHNLRSLDKRYNIAFGSLKKYSLDMFTVDMAISECYKSEGGIPSINSSSYNSF